MAHGLVLILGLTCLYKLSIHITWNFHWHCPLLLLALCFFWSISTEKWPLKKDVRFAGIYTPIAYQELSSWNLYWGFFPSKRITARLVEIGIIRLIEYQVSQLPLSSNEKQTPPHLKLHFPAYLRTLNCQCFLFAVQKSLSFIVFSGFTCLYRFRALPITEVSRLTTMSTLVQYVIRF